MFRKILLSALTVALIAGAGLVPKNAMAYECWVRLQDPYGNGINGATVSAMFHGTLPPPNGANHGWFGMVNEWGMEEEGWYHLWMDFPQGWGEVTDWKAQFSGISAAPYDPPTNPTGWMPIDENVLIWVVVWSR